MAEWLKRKLPSLTSFYPVLIGASLGFLYYYFIGCNTGSCAITSNPLTSILYGSVSGLLFVNKPKQKPKEKENV